ncbi:MAG: hypothetical protein AB7M12_00530 [Hyphomonadaceae bacterium]
MRRAGSLATAFHEAGHAVTAIALGERVHALAGGASAPARDAAGDTVGRAVLSLRPPARAEIEFLLQTGQRHVLERRLSRNLLVTMAGEYAEARAGRRSIDAASARQAGDVRRLLEHDWADPIQMLGFGDAGRLAYVLSVGGVGADAAACTLRTAFQALRAHMRAARVWTAIDAVAHALRRAPAGELDGAAVHAVALPLLGDRIRPAEDPIFAWSVLTRGQTPPGEGKRER